MSEVTRDAAEPLFGSLTRFALGSVGSKMVMSVTGMGLWLFIVAHLAGNATIYLGHSTFNHYAAALHQTPALLWFVRGGMIIGFPLHIAAALRTAALNRAARPVPYAYGDKAPARLAAKSMLLSGLVVAAFFVYHLAHFTWKVTGPMPQVLASGEIDPYSMVVLGFRNPFIAVFYIVGQILLAAHLSHGLYSMFQHLGLWGRRWTPWLKGTAQVVGYGLCALFASVPLSVLLGFVKP